MRQRRSILILIGIALLVLAALLVFSNYREPTYLNIPLSAWVDDYGQGQGRFRRSGRSTQLVPAVTPWIEDYAKLRGRVVLNFPTPAEAIDHIGPAALPYLIRWIQYQPPRWFEWCNRHGVPLKKFKFIQASIDRHNLRVEGALCALRQLGPRAAPALPQLTRIVAGTRTNISDRAVMVLMNMGPPAAPALATALTNQHIRFRATIAVQLGYLGTNAYPALPHLMNCLYDSDATISNAASTALGHLRGNFFVPAVLPYLHAPDATLRAHAVRVLDQFGMDSPRVIPALGTALHDSDAGVRVAAAEALGHWTMNYSETVPLLSTSLDDPNPAVRAAAARSLGKLGDGSMPAMPALLKALKDPSLSVRSNATYALRSIDPALLKDKESNSARPN